MKIAKWIAVLLLLVACDPPPEDDLKALSGTCFPGDRVVCPKCSGIYGRCLTYQGACDCVFDEIGFAEDLPEVVDEAVPEGSPFETRPLRE